jgi:hypothetical protein
MSPFDFFSLPVFSSLIFRFGKTARTTLKRPGDVLQNFLKRLSARTDRSLRAAAKRSAVELKGGIVI